MLKDKGQVEEGSSFIESLDDGIVTSECQSVDDILQSVIKTSFEKS